MQVGKRTSAGLLSLVLVFLLAPVAIGQQDVGIEVPLDTVVRAAPGSEHLLGTAEVPVELRGSTCPVAAVAQNQSSVHPGNDLVVASEGDSIVLADVEREPGVVTVAEEGLSLGSVLTVTLIMGPDGVFSAGMTVKLCDIPETTTTTTEATTSTTTTLPTTTSTVETTTTVTVLPSTTVTTAPEASTTTAPQASTTVTVAPSSTGTVPETLPFTGGETDTAALVGLIALLAGTGLIALTREEAEN